MTDNVTNPPVQTEGVVAVGNRTGSGFTLSSTVFVFAQIPLDPVKVKMVFAPVFTMAVVPLPPDGAQV